MLARLDAMVKTSHPGLKGKLVDNHIILDIIGPEVHFWSPHLNFRVEPDEENPENSYVMGIIGPRPAVWTMFMFIYFSIGILSFIIGSYGVSKWMLGTWSWTLWAFPSGILFMLTAYLSGQYGEKLGADQVEILKQFIRDAIGDRMLEARS